MVKEEFYFDSRDGESKIHAVRYRPEDPGKIRCVLQVVHGMAEYAERYEEFAAFLVERGFVVTGDDHLGHGQLHLPVRKRYRGRNYYGHGNAAQSRAWDGKDTGETAEAVLRL